MSNMKIVSMVDSAVSREAAERKADVEKAVELVEEETISLQDQIDVINQRLRKLEEGIAPR